MKKEELWDAFVRKNPSFNGDGNITLSAAGLRKLFNQTYDHGHEQGFENGKAWQKDQQERFKPKNEAPKHSKAYEDWYSKFRNNMGF